MPEREIASPSAGGPPMAIVVVGCGRVGAEMALTLCR
jgi:hypothetical protein